jgi:hypothetical protein
MALALLGLLRVQVAATPGTRYVATTGTDAANDCTLASAPCETVQHAVDVANPGETIKIATGIYTDVHGRPAPYSYPSIITQVVYLSKTVTVRGGYDSTFAEPPDSEAHPTTLDAQGRGRVVVVTSNATATIEGLRLTGGQASRLGGGWDLPNSDAGGGVYVNGRAMISDCQILENSAVYAGFGGGVYVCCYRSSAVVSHSTITGNRAARGGGLYLMAGDSTLTANRISGNGARRHGGGLYADRTDMVLVNNIIADNGAEEGSGLYIRGTSAHLLHNTVANNSGEDGLHIRGLGHPRLGCHVGEVRMTNTIVAGHTVGAYIDLDTRCFSDPRFTQARMEGTLWWDNDVDYLVPRPGWAGGGVDWRGLVTTGTVNVRGNPALTSDYHLGIGSAAIDAGVDAGVTEDIDGEVRPQGAGYDIGAVEAPRTVPVGGYTMPFRLPTLLKWILELLID